MNPSIQSGVEVPRSEVDPYSSRSGSETRVLPRQDPVIWGEAARPVPKSLDTAGSAQYAADGFVFLPGLFSAREVVELRAASEALLTDPALEGRDEVVIEPSSEQIRSIFRFEEFSPELDRVTRDPRLIEIARYLLGGAVYLHQTRINYKRGFRASEFYWHSDFETWHVEDGMPRMRALSMSIALDDIVEQNGPLMVIPGSQHFYVSCPGRTPEDNYRRSLRKQELGVPPDAELSALVARGGIAVPTGPAGSVMVFDSNTMHGSNSNITPWPRRNLFLVFNSIENQLGEPFGAERARPDYIANRTNLTPLSCAGERP